MDSIIGLSFWARDSFKLSCSKIVIITYQDQSSILLDLNLDLFWSLSFSNADNSAPQSISLFMHCFLKSIFQPLTTRPNKGRKLIVSIQELTSRPNKGRKLQPNA